MDFLAAWSRLQLICVTAAVLASAEGILGQDAPQAVAEHDVKAAYLYNFARFVTWPVDVPAASEPFRLCVVADGQMLDAVVETMAGETINGRSVETPTPQTPDEARTCQMLFLGRAAGERARTLLGGVRDSPVLTVGDFEGFVAQGGVIELVREQNRIRFDINSRNAARARLVISARLLRVARRVLEDTTR
jgi:hypothetical protein